MDKIDDRTGARGFNPYKERGYKIDKHTEKSYENCLDTGMRTRDGEDIYYRPGLGYCVEMDFRYLVSIR